MAWRDEGTDGIAWDAEADALAAHFEPWLDDALSPLLSRIGESSAVDAALKYGGVPLNLDYPVLDKPSVLASTVQQYRSSECVTTAGKLVDTILGGTAAAIQNAELPAPLQMADALASIYFEKVWGVSGVSIGDTLSNSIHGITVLGEGVALALVDDDTSGMESFHAKSLAGENGPLFQAASEAGEYYAKHGVGTAWAEFVHAVGDTAFADHLNTAFREGSGFEMAALGASPVASRKPNDAP